MEFTLNRIVAWAEGERELRKMVPGFEGRKRRRKR
jgi:hypothetical protein